MSEGGYISIALAEAKEPEVVPEGPYQLVIAKAEEHKSESSGKDSIACILEIEGEPNAAPVFHYVALPHESDDEKGVNNKLLMAKRFLEMFSIPFEGDGFNVGDFLGATGRAFLGQEPDNNGVIRNKLTYKKIN